jgi:ABC-type Mn2+/Zn2+ transport system ATPase subunit
VAGIACTRLTMAYGSTVAVRDVDLQLPDGGLLALVGPSGAGKTTLLKAMAGRLRPAGGSVLVGGRPAGAREVSIGYVPQVESVDWDFPITVSEVLLHGRADRSWPWPWASRIERRDCGEILERLGLGGLARRRIAELSGGQQQRVFLARALFRGPAALLLDEPTSGADVGTKRDILNLLFELNAAGTTVVLTTHDLNGVATHLPRVAMVRGALVADGPPSEVFTPQTLFATFGAEMAVFRHGHLLLAAEAPGHALDHDHEVSHAGEARLIGSRS